MLILCIGGLPFLGIFFSKHVLFDMLYALGCTGHIFCMVLCLFLTSVYTFRLVRIFFGSSSIVSYVWIDEYYVNAAFAGLFSIVGMLLT